MRLRRASAGLAASVLLASVAGARGFASLVLLAAICVAAARLLDTVGSVVDGVGERWVVWVVGWSLVLLVAAAAAGTPLLALVPLVFCGVEELTGLLTGHERAERKARRELPDFAAELAEVSEARASRAA